MKIPTHALSLLICVLIAFRPFLAVAAPYALGACSPIPGGQSCIDSTPCKTLSSGETVCLAGQPLPNGAYALPSSCWQYSYHFACQNPAAVDTCTQYQTNPACSLINSVCSNISLGTNVCNEFTQTYSCITTPAQTTTVLQCSNDLFNALPRTPVINNTDSFVRAATASEIIREASTYQDANHKIFGGLAEHCTKGYGGLKDCCKSAPGAKSNSVAGNIATAGAFSAIKYAGANAVDLVSPYMFDAMYTYAPWAEGFAEASAQAIDITSNITGNSAMQATGTNFAAQGPTLSLYGFTYGSSATIGSGFLGGNMTMTTFGAATSNPTVIVFNPYVFAAYLALNYFQQLLACTEDEQKLAMHKGAKLSAEVGSHCSATVPIFGGCIEDTYDYCSFNSVLAKIINIQGKPQLGLPITDCAGISATDLSHLNFTTMDFSEFTGEVLNQASHNIPTNMKSNYTPVMQSTTQGSSQQVSPALPTYP